MDRGVSRLTAAIVVTAGMWFMGPRTVAAYSHPPGVSPSALLQRSFSVMAAVRAVHGIGHVKEREVELGDIDSAGSWRVQGDCALRGLTTTSKFSVKGRQTGRHAKAVDEQYTVRVNQRQGNLSVLRWSWAVWTRTAHPASAWRHTGVTHDARITTSMCPSLIIPQLRLHLPGPVEDMGRGSISGRHAEHLQSVFNGQGGGETVDVYVDLASFRWSRVELSGWGAGCCHAYNDRFDYSRYNVPVTINLPSALRLSTKPFVVIH